MINSAKLRPTNLCGINIGDRHAKGMWSNVSFSTISKPEPNATTLRNSAIPSPS